MKKIIVLIIAAVSISILPNFSADGHHGKYIRKAPPHPKKVFKKRHVRQSRNTVYIAGHWFWSGHKYKWNKARYVKARKGYNWKSGYWHRTRHGWQRIKGHWIKIKKHHKRNKHYANKRHRCRY